MKNLVGIVEIISRKEKGYGLKVKPKDEEAVWVNGWGSVPEDVEEGVVVNVDYEIKTKDGNSFKNIKRINIVKEGENNAQAKLPEEKKTEKKTEEKPEAPPQSKKEIISNIIRLRLDCANIISRVMQGQVNSTQKADEYIRNVERLFKYLLEGK